MIELLTTNHFDRVLDLFDTTKSELKIISPFLSQSMADKLCAVVKDKGLVCTFITRFYLEDFISKANSLDALEQMIDTGIEVYAVRKLHTKLYLFDRVYGVLGSANFTNGGFKSNIELSVLIDQEKEFLEELHLYFDNMKNAVMNSEEGLVTKAVIANAREHYKRLFTSKKHAGKGAVTSLKIYGAALNKKDTLEDTDAMLEELKVCRAEKKDIVTELFTVASKSEQIKYPYTIWLKFDGEGNDRLNANEGFPMTVVKINGKTCYLSNYPFKVGSIKDNDDIYMAALTTDTHGKNQPVIVGRGKLEGFKEENHVTDSMIEDYDWMVRYPWYCIICESEVLDTTVNNGIPMDEIWDALGSDTYVSSFGRNEDIASVGRKHYQKAHIRLSGNAKELIDKKFEVLKSKYGVIQYTSEK